jgi:hypothetical protein
MGGFLEPSPLSQPQRDTNWLPIGLGVVLIVAVVGIIAWFSRTPTKTVTAPPPYVANLKFSDLKMSTAQNFVGATVTYIDGTITNTGSQTVTHAAIHVIFKDSMNQTTQLEDAPLRVLQSGGPYLDTLDLNQSPLAPAQAKPFRLTFEHVSAEWNQAYPNLSVTDVTTK